MGCGKGARGRPRVLLHAAAPGERKSGGQLLSSKRAACGWSASLAKWVNSLVYCETNRDGRVLIAHSTPFGASR